MDEKKIIVAIVTQSLTIFSLVSGIFGVFLFSVMLRSLTLLKTLGRIFNKTYSLKKMEKGINYKVEINLKNILFSHNRLSGIFLCMISVCLIFALAKKLDLEKFVSILKLEQMGEILFEVTLKSLLWIFYSILGFVIVYGTILFFNKNIAKKIDDDFDKWYAVDDMIESKLERTITKDIDTISFLRNKMVGKTGLVISILLVLISMFNLFLVYRTF